MLFTNHEYNCFAKDPAVIEYNGYYYLYYTVYTRQTGCDIGIARSEDGDQFEELEYFPRTQECEKNGVAAPAAIVMDGVLHLFYQTYWNEKLDSICHATSTDGIHFVKDESNPVFAPREPWAKLMDWACGRAIDADICVFNNKLFLYYATRDKDYKRQIVGSAAAELTSGFGSGSFTMFSDLALEPILDWEGDCIEAPATIVKDGRLYMFYGGAYNCKPQQIGCAVSEDGVHFKRLFVEEPFLKCGKEGEWNSCESGHPYVYEAKDGRIWLYYQGTADMGKTWYLSRCELGFRDGIPFFR